MTGSEPLALATSAAVASAMTSGGARLLISFAKTNLWVVTVTLPVAWFVPSAQVPSVAAGMTWTTLFGGFRFGVDATLNMGCAISTLTRLAEGQVRMLLTLMAFSTGIVIAAPGLPPDAVLNK